MSEDKSFVTTIKSKIYQYERNADTLVILTPVVYGNVNIADCTVFLRYILPDGEGNSEQLVMEPDTYNSRYYKFHLDVDTTLTDTVGEIECWLDIIDVYENVILTSGTELISVSPRKDITNYLNSGSLNQLDRLHAEIELMKQNQVNGLDYDDETRNLQLTANGAPVDKPVIVPGDKYGESIMEDATNKAEDEWVSMNDLKDLEENNSGSSWESM